MTVESLNRLSHDSTVSKTDPLLEFHRCNKIRQLPPVTRDSVLNYLECCSGSLVSSTAKTNNISQFKETFRSTLNFSQAFKNRETSSTLGDKEFVNIHQKVSYSCQIYNKPKKVLKSSLEYKKYLAEQKKNKLGSIEALHKTLNELRGVTKISTLEKTRWDWSTFKQKTIGNENFGKSKKYLATQAFLSSVSFSQYHQVLNARRRNRLQ
ncbi:uncharacterized protein LOC128883360 isoform X2 [Hylaeus volcanicus]|nr:uncharacterized protein LOC128883360 isoform X2 [Hylaeus volcanicus]XP_053991608.1 uncharacterized protein LOC128883360 isoform X2 [Hylaeus volcanicus]